LLLGVFWKVSVSGAVEWLHLFLVMGTYFVWYWRRNGQTLSMQTWHVRLVRSGDNGTPSLKQCLVRYVLSWPSVCFFGAGLVWALCDRERQFLHDRLSGTRLVYFEQETGD
ncbi:MAG: RDD family protein, partial [Rhodocyclaceae bacterium]|nr:RDD family protein [Rhodocyclaceae bacterium]